MKFLEENLLDLLRRPEFDDLRSALTAKKHAKGSFISSPADRENSVFIVSRGRARIYLGYEDKEFSLGILSPGDIYSTHTRAFVQALDEVELLSTDTGTFHRNMLKHPEITKAMVGILGNMLKTSFTIIESLAFKDVNGRLVELLANEAERHGEPDGTGGVVIRIDLSVEQIALLVGSTRQTVSTFLNALSRQGLVTRVDRERFKVSDLEVLKRLGGPDGGETRPA